MKKHLLAFTLMFLFTGAMAQTAKKSPASTKKPVSTVKKPAPVIKNEATVAKSKVLFQTLGMAIIDIANSDEEKGILKDLLINVDQNAELTPITAITTRFFNSMNQELIISEKQTDFKNAIGSLQSVTSPKEYNAILLKVADCMNPDKLTDKWQTTDRQSWVKEIEAYK